MLVLFFLYPLQPVKPAETINRMWAEVSRTVEEGDFEGYAALYHPEAVIVDAISGSTDPISVALENWKAGFEDTKAGKMKASVAFRFSQRIHGETSAHETGIFRYTSQAKGGGPQTVYVDFQALLVPVDGQWKMLMEYQMGLSNREAWEALEE